MARRRDDDDDDLVRTKARRDEDDDDLDDEVEADEDLDPAVAPARNNAYTGILTISLLALIAACVLFYLDASELGSTPIPQPAVSVPGMGEQKQALQPGPGK